MYAFSDKNMQTYAKYEEVQTYDKTQKLQCVFGPTCAWTSMRLHCNVVWKSSGFESERLLLQTTKHANYVS